MTDDRTHLERRDILQALGGTATAIGLAGCLSGDGGDGSDDEDGSDGGDGSDDGGGSDGGDGSDDGGGDSSDDEDGSDGEDGGSEDESSEDSDGADGEEEPEEVTILSGAVYEFDGETEVSQGLLTLIDNLGNQVTTHDLTVNPEFRLTGLEINAEYELELSQMDRYPDQTVAFVAEPPEGYGEEDGDGEEGEEKEEREVQLRMAVENPNASIVDPETNSITMETGVTGANSYAWEGSFEFKTAERSGELLYEGELAANGNAYIVEDNRRRSQFREEDTLERVFVFEKRDDDDESEPVLDKSVIDPIKTGTNCRTEDNLGGYPDWSIHQAVQNGLAPFENFTYKGKETLREHPGAFAGVRTKVYEVDPEGSVLTFDLYANDETGDVVRIEGDFNVDEINERVFTSELLSIRGKIDFLGHHEDRFIGINKC